MNIDIITLFPKMFAGPFNESLISRAQKKGIVKIKIHNLRDWAEGKHNQVDDSPYGGGAGMVIKVDVLDRALKSLNRNWLKENRKWLGKKKIENSKKTNFQSPISQPISNLQKPISRIILLTPQGTTFSQKTAKQLAKFDQLILVCGHYEGFDERIRNLVDEEISIGDYVLTGGEVPAMVIAETIIRLLPGVVGKNESVKHESFENNLLDYPVYTKPEIYQKKRVPKILLSGNHQKIKEWRRKKALKKTKRRRPDLLK